MSVAFFTYTLALLVVCVLAGATCLSAFFVSRKKAFILAVGLFIFYLFDVSLIFQSEFLSQNLAYDQDLFYAIENPFWKIAMGAGFLAFMWLIVCDYLDVESAIVKFGPAVGFFLVSTAILFLLPTGKWQQFLFYSTRQAFMAWMALWIIVRYRRSTDELERIRMRKHRSLFIAFCALIVCIVLEDAFMILLADPSWFTPDFPLYLSERNFSENVLLLVFAACALRASEQTLMIRFENPPEREDVSIQRHIDDVLDLYCKRNGLSKREAEVLRLVLIGKDTQNIASSLQLALGTVKAHVHNILKKTGQATRQDLVRDFWKD